MATLSSWSEDQDPNGFSWGSLPQQPQQPQSGLGGLSFDTTPSPQQQPTSLMGDERFGPTPAPAPMSFDMPGSMSSMASDQQTPSAPSMPKASAPATPDFSSAVQELQGLTDPAQIAMKRDKLARDLYASLSSSGHEVKWQGDQLMVDGRAYVVGGIQAGEPAPGGGPTTGGDPASYPPVAGPTTGAGSVGQYGMPAGAQADKFNDPNYHSGKYDMLRVISKYPPTPEGLRQAEAELDALGYGDVQLLGDDKVRWNGDTIDLIQDVGGPGAKWWFGSEQEYQNAQGGQPGGPPVTGIDTPGAAGVPLTPSYAALPPAPPNPAAQSGWQPGQGPSYAPGDIGMQDIPNFDFQSLLDQLLQGDSTDTATKQLIQSILAHPETLDDRTVETMKAKSKEELADMQALDDQDLQRFGDASGIGDSAWLKSERNSSRRARDNSLIDSNRTIDLKAAETRAGDRRAAADLGMSYGNAKASQRQSAVSTAANASLQRAALTGDRLALRESLKQEATKLGQSADQVMSQWLTSQMDDYTRRYGIDTAANIDMRKLNQASQEFKEELAFKFAQLAQVDQQFGAGYGLDLAKFEANRDDEAYNRYTGGGMSYE